MQPAIKIKKVKRVFKGFVFAAIFSNKLPRGQKETMKLSGVEIPSNKKFGVFFALVFACAAGAASFNNYLEYAILFSFGSLIFFAITQVRPEILQPLNILWMRFGLTLSLFVSPVVFGTIFFGIFTPMAFLMRLFGRDELRLKFKNKKSHWIQRKEQLHSSSFNQQF